MGFSLTVTLAREIMPYSVHQLSQQIMNVFNKTWTRILLCLLPLKNVVYVCLFLQQTRLVLAVMPVLAAESRGTDNFRSAINRLLKGSIEFN